MCVCLFVETYVNKYMCVSFIKQNSNRLFANRSSCPSHQPNIFNQRYPLVPST